MSPAPIGWFVLQTEAQRERRAELALIELGFDAFLPVERHIVRHARKTETKERPLFRRYLFVHIACDMPEAFHMIREADGVDDFVRLSKWSTPRPVHGPQVEELRQRVRAGEFDFTPKALAPLEPGTPLTITGGHYIGRPAELLRMEQEDRVRVLFDFMGQTVEMNMPAKQVRAA